MTDELLLAVSFAAGAAILMAFFAMYNNPMMQIYLTSWSWC